MIRWWGRLFCRLIGTVLIIPALAMLFAVVRLPHGIPASVLLLVAMAGLSTLALGGMIIWVAPKPRPPGPSGENTGGRHH